MLLANNSPIAAELATIQAHKIHRQLECRTLLALSPWFLVAKDAIKEAAFMFPLGCSVFVKEAFLRLLVDAMK